MTRRLEAIGVSVDVPDGWEAEIDTGAGVELDVSVDDNVDDSVYDRADVANTGDAMGPMPRLHVANFALPEVRGDFGSGATERMRRGEVFVCLLEEDPAMASTRLYADGGLPQFGVDDFNPHQMQRPIAGQSGAQAFFHMRPTADAGGVGVDGTGDSKKIRAFVVYVVVGDHLGRSTVLNQINNIVASLRFE